MTLFALVALGSNAFACDTVEGTAGMTASVTTAHGDCTDARVPEDIDTSGFQGCSLLSGLSPLFPIEASHVYSVRVPIDGESRFEVDSVTYSLIDQAGVPVCNGGRSHRLDVWVQNTQFPDATPVLQFSTVVNPTPSGAPNDFLEIDVPNFIVAPNEQVFVGFEMTADASDDVLCVLNCFQGVASPTGGEHFWSNSATTPYAWTDIVTDFGIPFTPLIRISGDRLIIDPTASIGNGATLGEDVVVGQNARVRDRADIGDGAFVGADATVGHDATIGAGARVEAGALVQDRADVGAGATVGQGATIGHDVTVGTDTSVGEGTLVRARTQIGDGVVIGDGVTLGHDVVIGDGAEIGDGTVVRDRATIGAGATVGAQVRVQIGASVPAGATVPDGATVR